MDDFYFNPEILGAALAGTGLPIPKALPESQVRSQAQEFSTKIFDSWIHLHKIVERHESRIQKRWAKRKRQQKLDALLAAWPLMPVGHRPDIDAFIKEDERQRKTATRFKDAYMWPYINQEDLLKSGVLPLFIHSRARNTPDMFALSDFKANRLGFVSQAVIPIFLNGFTMRFVGRRDPSSYGELLSWEDDKNAFDNVMSGFGFNPGEGLQILETQAKIYTFLVKCCHIILHDIDEHQLVSPDYPIQPETKATPAGKALKEGPEHLSVRAVESMYRVPAHIDLPRIVSLLSAAAREREDQLWSLREDPGFFREKILEFSDHRRETVKDTRGKAHRLFTHHREETFWARVLDNVLGEIYFTVELLNELLAQAQSLASLHQRYSDKLSLTCQLPEDLLYAYLRFQHYLKEAVKAPSDLLRDLFFSSPPMKKYYVREPPPDSHTDMIRLKRKSDVKAGRIENQVFWLVQMLAGGEADPQLFLMGLTVAVDKLDHLIENESAAKELLTPCIASVVSDLALYSECLRQLELFQPWEKTFEWAVVEKQDALIKDFNKWSQPRSQLLKDITGGKNKSSLIKLGEPVGNRFIYPFEKRRTKQNVETLRQAEKELDEFWTMFDQNMEAKGAIQPSFAVRKILSQQKDLRRTPEWSEGSTTLEDRKASKLLLSSSLDIHEDLQRRTESTGSLLSTQKSEIKVKEKTRGTPNLPSNVVEQTGPLGVEETTPTFRVNARAHKVFRTLFHDPTASGTLGDLPWPDFVYAMTCVGFSAEKLRGSAWHFRPTTVDAKQSIQFHEPHPVSKLTFYRARQYGRRLQNAYGWHGKTFYLE